MIKPPLQLQPASYRANMTGAGLYVIVNEAGEQFQFHSLYTAMDTAADAKSKCALHHYTAEEVREAVAGETAVSRLISAAINTRGSK